MSEHVTEALCNERTGNMIERITSVKEDTERIQALLNGQHQATVTFYRRVMLWAVGVFVGLVISLLVSNITSCGIPQGVSWDDRPYPDIVPAPFGKWCRCPSVYMDLTQVYGDCPGMIERVREITPGILAGIREYSAARGLSTRIASDDSGADIIIRFYYQPCRELAWVGNDAVRPFDSIYINEHHFPPQPPLDCYCGVAYPSVSGSCIRAVGVWVNVAGCSALSAEQLEGYLDKVLWHESGHALWGLRDVYSGQEPGLMVYNLMTTRPSVYEEAVIDWLYGVP